MRATADVFGDVIVGDEWRVLRVLMCPTSAQLSGALQRALDVVELLALTDALLHEAHNDVLRAMVSDNELATALGGVSNDDWAQARAQIEASGDRVTSAAPTSGAFNATVAVVGDSLWQVAVASAAGPLNCSSVETSWQSVALAAQTAAVSALNSRLATLYARLRTAPASLASVPPAGLPSLVVGADSLRGVRWLGVVADDALLLTALPQGQRATTIDGSVLARRGALALAARTFATSILPLHTANTDRLPGAVQAINSRADSISQSGAPPGTALVLGTLRADTRTPNLVFVTQEVCDARPRPIVGLFCLPPVTPPSRNGGSSCIHWR